MSKSQAKARPDEKTRNRLAASSSAIGASSLTNSMLKIPRASRGGKNAKHESTRSKEDRRLELPRAKRSTSRSALEETSQSRKHFELKRHTAKAAQKQKLIEHHAHTNQARDDHQQQLRTAFFDDHPGGQVVLTESQQPDLTLRSHAIQSVENYVPLRQQAPRQQEVELNILNIHTDQK